jgi:purine-binding chemotaxis protein CheW
MSIVVHHDDEPFTLIVDDVGDVLSLPSNRFEDNPANLDPGWRELSSGVYRLDEKGKLMLVLNVGQVLKIA